MTAVTLYAVFADMAEADRIGRQMVEEGFAACVNILQPCRSIYRWEGAIETASEVPALFKTTMDGADRLIERITELITHRFDFFYTTIMLCEGQDLVAHARAGERQDLGPELLG